MDFNAMPRHGVTSFVSVNVTIGGVRLSVLLRPRRKPEAPLRVRFYRHGAKAMRPTMAGVVALEANRHHRAGYGLASAGLHDDAGDVFRGDVLGDIVGVRHGCTEQSET